MGAAYYIVLDSNNTGFDSTVDGKALSRESTRIDAIAKSLGLKELSEYVSMSPDAALLEMAGLLGIEDPNELPPENKAALDEMPAEQWYEASLGHDYATAVGNHIRQNPSSVKDANAVLHDLDSMAKVMEEATKRGLKWHMLVDY